MAHLPAALRERRAAGRLRHCAGDAGKGCGWMVAVVQVWLLGKRLHSGASCLARAGQAALWPAGLLELRPASRPASSLAANQHQGGVLQRRHGSSRTAA